MNNDKLTPVSQHNVLELLELKGNIYGRKNALSMYENGRWLEYTFQELAERSKLLASYLIEQGIVPEDRIAILSESRPQWSIPFFACVRSGAICVPIDTKLTLAEIIAALADAEPRWLFISSAFLDYARELKAAVPSIGEIIVINGDLNSYSHNSTQVKLLAELQVQAMQPSRNRIIEDTALIIYTSGTTGKPKGVMISFATLIFEVERLQEVMNVGPKDVLLSILPLNHLLELTGGLLAPLHMGAEVCYSTSLFPEDILRLMSLKKVSLMIVVPLFLKMLKTGIDRELQHKSKLKRRSFDTAFKAAKCLPDPAGRRLLFHRLHKRFGRELRSFVCGGAKLEDEVAVFFDRLGLPIYQGYGLTETGPVITLNTPHAYKIGSVGKPLVGAELRLLKSDYELASSKPENSGVGEILTRGPHLMKGYYRRDDLTKEVIDDEGWFHTGDLGKIDEDGFLYITGRCKNLIVLPGGKKVQAEEVEAFLRLASSVKEASVVPGQSREKLKSGSEEVCAVIVPTDEARARAGHRLEVLERDLRVEIDACLSDLASYKRPSRIVIRLEALPRSSSGKVKRMSVLDWLYASQKGEA